MLVDPDTAAIAAVPADLHGRCSFEARPAILAPTSTSPLPVSHPLMLSAGTALAKQPRVIAVHQDPVLIAKCASVVQRGIDPEWPSTVIVGLVIVVCIVVVVSLIAVSLAYSAELVDNPA